MQRSKWSRWKRGLFILVMVSWPFLLAKVLEPEVTTDVFNIAGESRVRRAEKEIREIVSAVRGYEFNEQGLPDSLLALTSGTKRWLHDLEPGEIPRDPWERDYQYAHDPSAPHGFIVWSLGEDPHDDADDIRSDQL